MNEDKTVRRSKVYTYFYGRNTVFQQFLVIAGVLFLLLATVAATANYQNYMNKRENLYDAYAEAEDAYEDIYYECGYRFDVDWEERAVLDKDDEDYDLKREYNKKLSEYQEAEAKYDKFIDKGPSSGFMGVLCKIIGWLSVAAGVLWFIYKKLSFNKDGEAEYDEELKDKIEEAKQKALEKLNIIADQIERVEPVVLNGVAHTDGPDVVPSSGPIAKALKAMLRFLVVWGKIILGAIAVIVFSAIAGAIAKNMVVFVLVFVVAAAALGALGYYIYKKFEMESYVSPKVIKRLTMFSPRFISKLGSDENVRVSLPAITVYMFGDDQLYMYYQYLDIVTGRIFCEGVHEYFYEDIVGVTSSQETKKIFKRCGFMKLFLKSIDYLRESITVVTSGCTHRETYIVDMGNSLLDTQFIGMRNLIRQKKAEK